MISLHISYLVKQPIKISVLFLNMVRMFSQNKDENITNFVGIWLKIDFIMKGIVLVCIYLRFFFFFFEILLLTRVQLELTRR